MAGRRHLTQPESLGDVIKQEHSAAHTLEPMPGSWKVPSRARLENDEAMRAKASLREGFSSFYQQPEPTTKLGGQSKRHVACPGGVEPPHRACFKSASRDGIPPRGFGKRALDPLPTGGREHHELPRGKAGGVYRPNDQIPGELDDWALGMRGREVRHPPGPSRAAHLGGAALERAPKAGAGQPPIDEYSREYMAAVAVDTEQRRIIERYAEGPRHYSDHLELQDAERERAREIAVVRCLPDYDDHEDLDFSP